MFYGNATNTTNIAFQFDKIYETRYAMEQAIYGNDLFHIQRDYIAPGRYVLVSYGYDKEKNNEDQIVTTDTDFIRAYSNAINQESAGKTNSIGLQGGTYFVEETGTLYADADCTNLLYYTDFQIVNSPIESELSNYYIKKNDFYYKAVKFYNTETYYMPTVTGTNKQFVTKGTIVRRVCNNVVNDQRYVLSWDYRITTDTEIDSSKDYYEFNNMKNNYDLVTNPIPSKLSQYYERKNPTFDYAVNPRRNGYTEQFYICVGQVSDIDQPYREGYQKYLQLNFNGTNGLYGAAAFAPIALFTSADSLYTEDYIETYKQYTTPYLEHYNIDYAHFYTIDKTWGSLHRGYDATVWQKVITEGLERYILIAHLNALFPGIEVVHEPPSTEPIGPFIGAESTDMIARLHLQSPWGFEVKSYDTSDKTEEEIASYKSDEKTLVKRFVYNPIYEEDPETHEQVIVGYEQDPETNELIHALDKDGNYKVKEVLEPAYIYYNKAGLSKEVHADIDRDASNHIHVTPTGKSLGFDYKYRTSQLRDKIGTDGDIQQLDISLPAIGNMVSSGYDLIYGDGQEVGNTEHLRHLDTKWYNASETEFIKYGDESVYSGGKTFDLDTLAGTVNTYHNRLGQIIEPLTEETWPQSERDYEELNPKYIYEYDGEYYKVGSNYTDLNIEYLYYQCNFRQTEDSDLVSGKTYYTVSNGEFVPVASPSVGQLANYYEEYDEVNLSSWLENTYYVESTEESLDSRKIHPQIEYLNVRKYLVPYYRDVFDPNLTYYKRHLKKTSWYNECPVVVYSPDQFYYKNGQSYILERGTTPQAGEVNHYHIVEENSRSFTDPYLPGRFWVYEPSTGNYVKAWDEEPDELKTYYNITTYGNTFWDSPTGAQSNTETIGRSFLPYLGGFYYFVVDVNGVSYPILDTNNIPGQPDLYEKTTDSVINSNKTYYTYNPNTDTYSEVSTPVIENIDNYYVKIKPTSYYYYKLGEEPTLGIGLDGQFTITYQVESQHEITTLAFGETRTINGVTYTPGSSPVYYYDNNGDFILVTLEFLKSQDESFFDLNFNTGKYGGCWFIKPVDKTNDIFMPNKYWIRNDDDVNGISYQLATQTMYNNNPTSVFYDIVPYKVVQTSKNVFYEPGKYYYKEYPEEDYSPILDSGANPMLELVSNETVASYNMTHNFEDGELDKVGQLKYYYPQTIDETQYYPPDWFSDTLTEGSYYRVKGAYYKKAQVAIEFDATGEAPPYYRWLEDYYLVPWKFDLVSLNSEPALVKLEGFNNGDSSLNGQLLSLHNLLSLDDDYTRDPDTIQGALNQVQDKFYTLGEFIPGRIMYVNNYGRLTSSELTNADLLGLMLNTNNYIDAATTEEKIATAISNLVDNAPAAYDTLKEIADWIGNDQSGATQVLTGYNNRLNTLEGKTVLGTYNNNGNQVEYSTVKDYVEAYVGSSVSAGVNSVHTFANQSVLDGISSTNVTNWNTAYTNSHIHSNKSELDLIASGDVAKWNAKQDAIAANTYDAYGAASAAQTAAQGYADGLASNYEVAGAAAAVIGESTDDKTDLTLYGLLAYIDELEQRIAALEPTPEPEP